MRKDRKFNRWVYYRVVRLAVKAKWARNKLPKELTKAQDSTMKITLALIADRESELLINPTYDENVGEKYYIKKIDEQGNLEKFVTISKTSMGYSITLLGHEFIDNVRHNYHYDIWFSENCGKMIVDRFVRVIRRRRNQMEIDIRKDDERTLESILKKLDKKRK